MAPCQRAAAVLEAPGAAEMGHDRLYRFSLRHLLDPHQNLDGFRVRIEFAQFLRTLKFRHRRALQPRVVAEDIMRQLVGHDRGQAA